MFYMFVMLFIVFFHALGCR